MALPEYISIVFLLCVLYTLVVLYWVLWSSKDSAVRKNSFKVLAGFLLWIGLQIVLSVNGIYSKDASFVPPKIFLFGILPLLLFCISLFFTQSGRRYIDSLSLKRITFLHLVRIPVEFVLLWLYLEKTIPQILTFEGWNFDILMGLTAPLIIYFGFVQDKWSKIFIMAWNVIGILMLGFVFVTAILAAPFPLQQIAFDQPNVALLHFPFSLLPTFIVPVVLLGHFVTLRTLLKQREVVEVL